MNLKNLISFFLLLPFGILASNATIVGLFEVNGISYAFDDVNMTASVSKPKNGSYNFYTGLVNIPETVDFQGQTFKVIEINREAFANQQELTGVIIPKTVELICYRAFQADRNLQNVVFNPEGKLSTIEFEAFQTCVSLTSISFPKSLKIIEDGVFSRSGLKTINWGEIEVLGNGVFTGCDNLLDLELPNTLKSIGTNCFWGLGKLKSVSFGESIESIGQWAFLDCQQLENIKFNGNNLKEIGIEAFRGCWMLNNVKLPQSLTTMGRGAFRYCVSLTNIDLGGSLTSIEGYSFEQTSLEKLTIPNSVKSIGTYAFLECTELSDVQFGNGVSSIGQGAFEDCKSLTELEIPEPLQSIGVTAFANCDNLQLVSIPRTVSNISDMAFLGCSSLANLYNHATVPQEIYNRNVFQGAGPNNMVNVHVYEGLYDVYMTALGWYDIGTEYLSHVNIIADIPVVSIESIEFTEDILYCGVGEMKSAEIKYYPEDATPSDLLWTSSNEAILYVDLYSGNFIGLQNGEAYLTVTLSDNNISASVKVIVGEDAGINGIENDGKESKIFNINGQKLPHFQKGINIINGRKILVK